MASVWNVTHARYALQKVLTDMKSDVGALDAMFIKIVNGFVLPGESHAGLMPLACILPPQGHAPEFTDVPYAIVRHRCLLPVFAYFNTYDPAEAAEKMIRFIGMFNDALIQQDYTQSWGDDILSTDANAFNGLAMGLSLRVNSSDTGQVLKRIDVDYEIQPPFWGVLVEVAAEWCNSGF
jgi:hypothetical protein